MSEETMENEVEANPLQDMIQHALDQNFNKANDIFNSMMTVRMSDLLDQEKVAIADQIYNDVETEDEDEEDDQLELDLETEDDVEEDQEWDDEEESEDNSSEEVEEEEISSE